MLIIEATVVPKTSKILNTMCEKTRLFRLQRLLWGGGGRAGVVTGGVGRVKCMVV